MKETLTIPKIISPDLGKDYAWLREAGMQHIEQLASKIWTDYNTHDPGITILELLCWVITDLQYRCNMPMEDILASEKDNVLEMHRQFLSALNIFPNAPVTPNDYRSLFTRVEGVKNAWLQKSKQSIIANYNTQPPSLRYAAAYELPIAGKELSFELNGLYDILLDIEPEYAANLDDIKSKVVSIYQHFRNLCEDLVNIREVPTQEIVICGEIELEPQADPEDTWAMIIYAIENYLSPSIRFYTLQEMQAKGKTSDEIFEGPQFDFYDIPLTGNPIPDEAHFYKKGFVDMDEVASAALREQVRLSDIIKIIMKIPGVKLVKSLQFGFCGCDELDPFNINQILGKNEWLLCVKPGHKPVLCMTNSVINFYKDVIPVELKKLEAQVKLQGLKDAFKVDQSLKEIEDLPMPQGKYRNISNYGTMQHHLPETYGISQAGLPETASTERKALAKQLKAYLLFFDQILANYFSQLANVKELLSANSDIKRSYFNNVVKGIKGIEDIYEDAGDWENSLDWLMQQTGLDNYVERKNKFLDHLLARFSEAFNEYVFLLHRIYGEDYDHAIIQHKRNFYNDYKNMSTYRGDALDYYNKKTPAQRLLNVSGMEKRISRLLGFNHYKRQALSQLHYDIFKITPADPLSKFNWIIDQAGTGIFSGTGIHTTEIEAYEEMGLASILACNRDNYRVSLSADQSLVSIDLVDSNDAVVATANSTFPVLPGEIDSGVFSNAETAIDGYITYFTDEFRLEGMYVVEHILLRPDNTPPGGMILDTFMPLCIDVNGNYCRPLDPYSYRIAVILPGYSMRLRNKDFRKYAERMIRLETPAHILPRICFIGIDQMKEFEEQYELWLTTRIERAEPMKQVPDAQLKKFIELLEDLYTVYETGTLADCDDDTDNRNPVILGRTNLGSLEVAPENE
ncbi:hypothetical protein COR50_15050 [Chitinophaga caeni]|uniref:Baseplate protein J-like domain-containing protein n=1 Tax=Chitinophaga caeni TaxID=2029983 RepID=A0A291QWW3_9BACT|nr:hypothetical protein [Chitinophaga caeni]ATL48372.1 hypothetical protein COR50_15050 [Chitinophaga caeni]